MKVFDIRNNGLEEMRKCSGEEITLTGCLGERYIGCGMKDGILHVEGTPGNALASYLDGGTVYVDGNAQDAAADTMNAGLLAVKGSAGDALAYGMRGGHRSILVIGGRAGSFLGEYLAGGIIIVLGMGYEGKSITGYFCGNGMYAGTIYLRTETEPLNLSDKLIRRSVGEKEKEDILRPIITDFASVFSIPAEQCIEGSFIAIEADKSKSYSQLYAAV